MFNDDTSVSKEKIKDTLKNYDSILASTQNRIRCLEKELLEIDSMIKSISFPELKLDEGTGKHGKVYKDLSDTVLDYEKLWKKRIEEIRDEIDSLVRYMYQIHKIYGFYLKLPKLEYEMLTTIYIEKEGYKTIMIDKRIAKKTIVKIINDGLDMIQEMYEHS